LVENRRLEPNPPLVGAPLGVIPLEFRGDFWHQKTRVPVLSYGVVCVILGITPTCGRQTDRKTDGYTMTAYTVKVISNFIN